MKILIVEDDKINRIALTDALKKRGHLVDTAESGNEGTHKITENAYDLIITDLKLPGFDGLKVLEFAKKKDKEVFVIVITGYATVDTAVKALKLGAYDYLTKPYPLDELINKVNQIQNFISVKNENERLKKEIEKEKKSLFVGKTASVLTLLKKAEVIAESDTTVLIEGESGTGKEVLAKTIHMLSNRKNAPFVGVNCAAIPESLLESELFGYKKGAFSGAVSDKKGLIESANGGTFFIDDIDDMPLNTQVKLLRTIQEREIYPVGCSKPVKVDIRIICATKKSLKELVEEGKFREDLYYRLNVVYLKIPPLRERREDIPILLEHFMEKYGAREETKKVIAENLQKITEYNWPGNVRELENFVQKIMVFPEIPENFLKNNAKNNDFFDGSVSLDAYIDSVEREIIVNSLEKFEWNISKTAEFLKIPRTTLRSKLKKYGISRKTDD